VLYLPYPHNDTTTINVNSADLYQSPSFKYYELLATSGSVRVCVLGVTGLRGPSGATGFTGATGDTGDTGATGIQQPQLIKRRVARQVHNECPGDHYAY